jgi:hypothetical protein
MYRRFGFEVEGVRKNYYAESNEDALIMWARGVDAAEYADRLAAIGAGLRGVTVDETSVATRKARS